MKSSKYIAENCERIIAREQKIKDCKHDFTPHGYGYQCLNCGLYTGMDLELNRFITEELKNEDRSQNNS